MTDMTFELLRTYDYVIENFYVMDWFYFIVFII